MNCAACRHENPDGSAFCEECGARFERRCPACGSVCTPAAKFCRSCGTALADPEPIRRERSAGAPDDGVARKVITIVFADLIGSTSLHERLDPESVSRVMERYHSAVRGVVEAHGGTVVQLLGDGVMCAFGVPHVAEDDAIRAVRAAVAVQDAFRDFAREQREVLGTTGLRVAVNTGEVVVSDDYAAGIGDPLNVAARLQQEARDGDVLIGEATHRLVRDRVTLEPLGTFALKGRAESVTAYRVMSLERPAGVPATPFVGRDEEVARLMAVYDAAVTGSRARLAVILGSPGLGKSRLLAELARRVGDRATVVTARCDAAGVATFAPIAEALRAVLRIDDSATADALRAAIERAAQATDADPVRIASGIAALLAGAPAPPEETFFVVRRLLAALAAKQPLVLAIDDLQWAEPLLLDLTEHLVQWSTDVPLLVLVAARPELRDMRSSLATHGGLVTDVVTLGGLDAAAAMRLAANVVGAEVLPAAIAGRVLATSEGNPLFVGELVRMLVHDGVLQREGERWTTGVEAAALEMPPTIQALLAARLERLRPEERTVLERAAVVGRQFSRTALAQLLPREIADLDARLEALRRSELIETDTGWFLGEPALRFHHVLIRDAAYRRVLKGTRAQLHNRFADWLEAKVGDAVEHEESIGWHLEQAHQNLRDLGPVDEQGRTLGERAARYLAAAGRRALARDDLTVAAGLLGRALARLDETDAARAELTLDWCEALLAAGNVGPAAKAIAELGRFTEATPSAASAGEGRGGGRLHAWHTCFAGQLAALTDPQTLRATAEAVAAAAEGLAAVGDTAGEAKAHSVHALALARLGRVGACETALDRALAAARRAGDRRRSNAVLASAPLAALWGPSPVTRASGRCLDVVRVLRITQGAPAVEAVALRCQGVLEALRGRTEAARRMLASARRMVEELGIMQRLLEADVFAGFVDLLEGDAGAAERSLRAAYDGLRAHGLGIDAAQAAALLGRALLALGRAEEAEALSHESEALAGDDLRAAVAWRGVRAEAMARRGEHGAAVDFARAAVDVAAATDALLDHADARLALAAALRAAGRHTEAAAEEGRAIELWEAKGATLLAERARKSQPERRAQNLQAGIQEDGVDSRQTIAGMRDENASLSLLGKGRAREGSPAMAQLARRRVRPNAATAIDARLVAAMAARDRDALPDLFADGMEAVHHPTGFVFDKEGNLSSLRMLLLEAETTTFAVDPLATLGESLSLCRNTVSASSVTAGALDLGAVEGELVVLNEVDERGRVRRLEFFAGDHLGDAVSRLYERYAELLPGGPERDRAAATARSVSALLGPADRWPFAPDAEARDHRTVGFGTLHGAEVPGAVRALMELSDDFQTRIDDVLDLRRDALLVCQPTTGTLRASGGPFERLLCMLWVFGADGLVSRWEQFDTEQDAEALARFDELTGDRFLRPVGQGAEPTRRRVRPNAATAHVARVDAAMAARNDAVLPTLLADRVEIVDHVNGAEFGRESQLASWRSMLRAEGLRYQNEPLAALGESLALCRFSLAASGVTRGKFDVGAYEVGQVLLIEADASERRRRVEQFGADHLGDAIARLYRRHAELRPEGPERIRAAATARSFAALLGPADLDRWATALAPAAVYVDRRTLGVGSAEGAAAFLRVMRTLVELADGVVNRADDVLALRADAILLRWTNFGTDRASGGSYVRPLLWLGVFGADGLLTRLENFDPDRDDEALARFDELTAEPAGPRIADAGQRRPVRSNAAIANARAVEAAVAARDGDAFESLIADDARELNHRHGIELKRSEILRGWRTFLSAEDFRFAYEPLAALGESLALCRSSHSASGLVRGRFDVGPYELESINLIEVDAQGRRLWNEYFANDRLGEAVAGMYERYAGRLPDGPERRCAAGAARAIAIGLVRADLERVGELAAPDFEYLDHRMLGLGSVRGTERNMRGLRALRELSDDLAIRVDDILDLRSDAFAVYVTSSGIVRATGGTFETQYILLLLINPDGRVARLEQFDSDRHAEALARLDDLIAGMPPAVTTAPRRRVRPNAANATANAARADAAIAARDVDTFLAAFADDCEIIDHPTGTQYGRRQLGDTWRRAFAGAPDLVYRGEELATLGERLALLRHWLHAGGATGGRFDVGEYEIGQIILNEVDEQGRIRRSERFALDHLGDAIARLYECYAELLPDGPARHRAAATARSIAATQGPSDRWPGRSAPFAPDVEARDHRTVGFGSLRGIDAVLRAVVTLRQLSEGLDDRFDDVLGLHPDALLVRATTAGTIRASGGVFEQKLCQLFVFGADGLIARWEQFDAEQEDEALARFDELALSPVDELTAKVASPRIDNAVTRLRDRFASAWAARDWEEIAATFAADFRLIDRRRYARFELDRDQHLESLRFRFEMSHSRTTLEVIATRGNRLALIHQRFELAGGDVGPSETESLNVVECDEHGNFGLLVTFDSDDLDGAYAELDDHYAAGEAAPFDAVTTGARAFAAGVAARDWDAVAAVLAPDLVVVDHRPLGWEELHGPARLVDTWKSLVALAPDVRLRIDHITITAHGSLAVVSILGTHEGGEFEDVRIVVHEYDGHGKIRRHDIYTLDQLDDARAGFEARRSDPLRIPPNAAYRARDQMIEASHARDWQAVRAMVNARFSFEDRTKRAQFAGDVEVWMKGLQFARSGPNMRLACRLIGTAGERIALEHAVTMGGPDGSPFEIEAIGLTEVDADGKLVALMRWDVEDRAAAFTEAYRRFAAGEAASSGAQAAIALNAREGRAFRDADWLAARECMADDLLVHDHRKFRLGALPRDEFIESQRVQRDLAPDLHGETIRFLAWNRHGWVVLNRVCGSMPQGGGPFENVFIRMIVTDGDRIQHYELFDPDAADRALARFEELCADRARQPLA